MRTEPATQSLLPRSSHDKPMGRKRPLLREVVAAAVVLLVAALVGVGYRTFRAEDKPRLQIETLAATRGPISAKVTATGTLSALVMVNVGSQVSGRIATLSADFGSHVTKGQVVATLDPSLFQAAVQQSRANVAAADAQVERFVAQTENLTRAYDRARSLAQQSYVAAADLDAAEASLRVAKADLKAARAGAGQSRAALAQAELNLHYATIISPIDGTVISRNVDVGQTVAAMLQAPTLFTIAQDLTRMQVDTSVPEADVGKIHEGMDVTFSVDAYPAQSFSGRVRQVRDNAQSQQNVVTYDAVVDVENPEHLLKPGMTASVTFVYAKRDDAVRVPNAALRFRPDAPVLAVWRHPTPTQAKPGERVAWLVRDERVEPAFLKLGISDGTWTELISGDLKVGDRLVTEASAAH